jgi:hypothetical protein
MSCAYVSTRGAAAAAWAACDAATVLLPGPGAGECVDAASNSTGGAFGRTSA